MATTHSNVKTVAASKTAARRGIFQTRPDTFKDQLAAYVLAHKGKPINLDTATKHLYGDTSAEWRIATKMVVLGLNVAIEELKLPFQKIKFSGKGEDATFILVTKSKRAAK